MNYLSTKQHNIKWKVPIIPASLAVCGLGLTFFLWYVIGVVFMF